MLVTSYRYSKLVISAFAVCFSVSLLSGHGFAQDAGGESQNIENGPNQPAQILGVSGAAATMAEKDLPPEVKILREIEKEIREKASQKFYERSGTPSLVFTPSQYALLREARVGFNTRAPSMSELKTDADPNDPNYKLSAMLRNVTLGGIAFETPDNWTIWLNNARVTPDAIPAEAVDLRVYKDFIELKWFDAYTNQVYPVRLRPNQKFNLDSRIFLPG